MTELLIRNDGELIVGTNFWSTDLAARGFCYLSWNAGAARLLLPAAQAPLLEEMQTGKDVVLSCGPWPEQKRDGIEILFDDGSENPFALHLDQRQSDRTPDTIPLAPFHFTVWLPPEAGQLPTLAFCYPYAKLRRVDALPCLKAWGR